MKWTMDIEFIDGKREVVNNIPGRPDIDESSSRMPFFTISVGRSYTVYTWSAIKRIRVYPK